MRKHILLFLFAAAVVAMASLAGASRAQADDVNLSVDIDTLGLECDGDSAPAIVRALDRAGAPVVGHEVTFGFIDGGDGVVTDPATGATGTILTGTTNSSGEWHLQVTPPFGAETSVAMVVGDEAGPKPFTMACPFPDDDTYSLQTIVFNDLDGNGRRGARERSAYRAQVGLAATGCCNFGAQIPPHWELSARSGIVRWNGLSQDESQVWKICVPAAADYSIVSVNGTPIEHENECQPLPPLREGRNRAAIGIAPK